MLKTAPVVTQVLRLSIYSKVAQVLVFLESLPELNLGVEVPLSEYAKIVEAN